MGKHTHEITGVNAARTGTNTIGYAAEAFPSAVADVEAIVVEQVGAADASWNVELDGQNLLSAEATVGAAGTPETFAPNAPNQSNTITANENAPIAIDVSTASGTDTSTLNVTVVTNDNRED